MKWIRLALYFSSAALLLCIVLSIIFFENTKPFFDAYGNHASVLGLVVSVVGFTLTVWTVLETLRASTKAQRAIQEQVNRVRQQTVDLLAKIKLKAMGDTCEQAFFFATEARQAIRSHSWLRAAERCQDARQVGSRLLAFQDLSDTERVTIRAAIEDIKTLGSFIERNRFGPKAHLGIPTDKVTPLDSYIDELERIRTRLQHQLLEIPNVHGNEN